MSKHDRQYSQKKNVKIKKISKDSSLYGGTNSIELQIQNDRRGIIIDDRCEKTKTKQRRKYCGLYVRIFMCLCCTIILVTCFTAVLLALLTNNTSKQSKQIENKEVILLTDRNETVYGLWNTTAGHNSLLSGPGSGSQSYNPNETPSKAFDQNMTTKYNSYGVCNSSGLFYPPCGLHTGIYLTLQRGSAVLTAIRFCTANSLPERDPMTITVEGSNQLAANLLLGSSWTLLYTGSSGLEIDPGRFNYSTKMTISNNVISYNSYRVLITSKRNISNSIQYSEIELFGYFL